MQNSLHTSTKISLVLTTLSLIFGVELTVLVNHGELGLFNTAENAITAVYFKTLLSNQKIVLPVIFFITVQLIIHILFVFYNYLLFSNLSLFIQRNFVFKDKYSYKKPSKITLYLCFFTLVFFNYFMLLVINNSTYPNSAFAFSNLINQQSISQGLNSHILYLISMIWLLISFTLCLLIFVKSYIQSKKAILSILTVILFLVLYNNFKMPRFHNISFNFISNLVSNNDSNIANNLNNNSSFQSNVVLITIDSLRYDYINKLPEIKNNYLDIAKFSRNTVKFNNAYTPLARSFPSLYSILSGNHPKQENIRFNLVNQNNINFNKLLPKILKDKGYQTLYATDSNQFHIINKDWGYKYLVAPKQGIYEQFLPRINDLPLSNLIINNPISKYLFPYTYSNQAAGRIYSPITYLNRITSSLDRLDKNKPMFLHFNFEAAHWPYHNRDLNTDLLFQDRYEYTLKTANWQINQVFKYLEQNNLLQDTLVIMASDHGEALSIVDDKIINKNNYVGDQKLISYVNKHPVNYTFDQIKKSNNNKILDIILDINTSGGHGVDVLSKSQYQVLIALQKFKNNQPVFKKQLITEPVVLTDIYPTVLSLLNINTKSYNSDNHTNYVNNNSLNLSALFTDNNNDSELNKIKSRFNNRNIFIETGLQVPYFEAKELKDKNILSAFIKNWSNKYYINNKSYLELSPESMQDLLKTKQYAIINNGSILAYIPTGLKQNWHIKNNTNFDINNCSLPRSISDSDGKYLATLCGTFENTPGYYIYYHGQTNRWALYPDETSFTTNQEISRLYVSLKQYYKNEIASLASFKADQTS